MDTLTHALSGALVGRAAAPAGHPHVTPAGCMALGFVVAALPDADVVLSYVSPLAYLLQHRGVTHSIVLLPLWAWAIAWAWSRPRRNRQGFRVYFLISALALAMHILGDLITSFGTMVFAPLSDQRIQWDTTFIIDPWLTGIVVAGLIAAAIWRSSRVPAVLGLALVCGYVGFQWTQQQRAIGVGQAYARAQGIDAASVRALPRPVSPFNWMVIVAEPERYRYAFINLRRQAIPSIGPDAGFVARLDSHYLPVASAHWRSVAKFGEGVDRAFAAEAWRQDSFRFFRWFSAFPMLAHVERGEPPRSSAGLASSTAAACAWFQDLRFHTPGRDSWPFRYGVCRSGDGQWEAYGQDSAGRPLKVSR